MRKLKLLLAYFCVLLLFVGCDKASNEAEKNEDVEKETKKVTADNYTDIAGNVSTNMIFDYSEYFDVTYEWFEGVKLPIDKPTEATVKFNEYNLIIENMEEDAWSMYIDKLKAEGYSYYEYSSEDSRPDFSFTAYTFYKDNIVINYNKREDLTNVYVLMGNVIDDREVSVDRVKELLGKEYSDYAVLRIAYDTVYSAGYSEFLIISPSYISGNNDEEPYYVIADKDKILLCEQGLWNPIYPMSVNLVENDGKKELVINYNDLPGSRSGKSVYPEMCVYQLKDGVFEKTDNKPLTSSNAIIGKMDNGILKYYCLKENEEYTFVQGRRYEWIIDEEYIPAD